MRKAEVIRGKNCKIERGVILGYSSLSKLREGYELTSPVVLGDGVHIRMHSIIYNGCKIGNHVHVGHNSVLREFTEIGDHSSIGSLVMCEGYTKIGHHSIIHSQTHLTAKMEIGNYVFIGPKATTANDRRIRYFRPQVVEPDQGPIIEDGAVIGAGAALLPKVRIGKGAFVAMGAVVTKDVPPFKLVMGVPAKAVRYVSRDEVVEALQSEYTSRFSERTVQRLMGE